MTTAAALLLLTAALVIGFKQWVTFSDDHNRAAERQLAANYLDRIGKTSVSQQMVQLTWDDALRAVGYGRDYAWADRYVGDFLWSKFRYDRLYLVSPSGAPLRAWDHGRPASPGSFRSVSDDVRFGLGRMEGNAHVLGEPAAFRAVGKARWPFDAEGRPLTRWSSSLIGVDGRAAILSVTPVLPDTRYETFIRAPNCVVAVRFLDTGFLRQMSEDLLLPNLRIGAAPGSGERENSYALTGSRGQSLGALSWRSMPLSSVLAENVTPIFAAYMAILLAVIAGGWAIVRALLRALRDLRQQEAVSRHASKHDAMTGLVNREQFVERLGEALESPALREGAIAIVAYFDLDNFKFVNDTLGHHVGDTLVSQVAKRCQGMLRPGDVIARMGGDEFAILRVTTLADASASYLGDEVQWLFAQPFDIDGRSIGMNASCGVSWAPEQAADPGELLRNADIALYRAKQCGRARWRAFTPDMAEAVRQRHNLESDLRQAIAAEDLSIAYQPIVATGTGRIDGFEALLRWTHPVIGDISPSIFVPIAEQCGKMNALGWWTIRRVFQESRAWPDYSISINLSPIQIGAQGFLDELQSLVEECQANPARFTFEITEGVLLDKNDRVGAILGSLREMGFRIALDDFGTGYSSLSYLRHFQFDGLKIDRAFVRDIEDDLDAHAILKAIVALGKTLRMRIVAEGVETPLQRDLVAAAGCEFIQGHLYWKAMTREAVNDLIAQQKPPVRLRKAS